MSTEDKQHKKGFLPGSANFSIGLSGPAVRAIALRENGKDTPRKKRKRIIRK